MTDAAEVKVKLVVDSNSAKIAEDMKKDLAKVEGAAKKTGDSMGSKLTGGLKAGAVAAGMIYAELAKAALHYGKEALVAPIEAYMEQQKQVKQLANTFAVLDQAGNSMDRLKDLAKDVEANMGDLAMKTGQTGDDLVAAFNNVIERGGKTVEAAEELTESMAYAARVVPGGLVGISEGFEAIQMGMVKAKNPLVGLISATGTLKGSAKDVAKEMKGMSIDKQMELAESAIKKMAEKTKDLPMTFGQAKVVLNEVKDNLLETAGAPLTKAFSSAVLKFKNMFVDAQGEATPLTKTLTEGAEYFGKLFSHVFEMGSAWIGGFMSGVTIFGDEFRLIWKEIFGESDQTWKNMVEYSKYAGMVIGGFVKFFAAGVGALIVVVQKVVKYVVEAIGLAAEIAGKISGSKGVTDFGKKAQQLAFSSEQEDRLAKIRKSGTGSVEAQELRKDYITTAGFTGQTDYLAKLQEAEDQRKAVENQIAIARSNANVDHAKQFYDAFAVAAKMQDEAAMKNIASFMGNNKAMAEAIGKLGPDVLGAAKDDFIKALEAVGGKDAADALKKASRPDLKISKANITQNFSGGIQIKQDFKDADPDRVIVAFKTKLANVGSSRLQAKTASPFGF